MARIAKKTTFGIEHVGGGVEVRRRVVAGQEVPAHYEVPADAVQDTDEVAVHRSYRDEQVTRRVGADGTVKKSAHTDDPPKGEGESAQGGGQAPRRSSSRGGKS